MSDAQPYASEGAMEGEVDKSWDPNDESGIASFSKQHAPITSRTRLPLLKQLSLAPV